MSRISTDGSFPQKNWDQATHTTSATPDTATVLAAVRTPAERCIIRAASTNSDSVTIGPTSAASHVTLAANEEYLIQAPPYVVFDIARWYSKSPTASQALSIIFI